MTDILTLSGTNVKLLPSELAYLQSFLGAGDRGGFYMAYYAMASTDDPASEDGLLFAFSEIGKLEASLQTKVATFSGRIGSIAYLTNRLLEEASSEYPGIYLLSQRVALEALEEIGDQIDAGKTGLISDSDLFGTAREAWQEGYSGQFFPGELLVPDATTAFGTTMQRVVDFAGWLEDYWLANGQLPSRAEMIAWIGADGTRAAAIATFYAHMERLTGKQLSDYEGKPGYTFIKSPDGNQTLVVDEDGHVVAARVDGANGASTFETADYAAPAIQAALLALGLTLAPSLTAVIGSGAVGLAFVLGEVFTPYIPDDWSDLTYPVGEARPSQGLPSGDTPWAIASSPTSGNDTLFGSASFLGILGKDAIDGGAGNDAIFGGGGDDQLTGGEGDDILWGQEQKDQLTGGAGADVLRGGEDDDVLRPGTSVRTSSTAGRLM